MGDRDDFEKAQAGAEAREAVVRRPAGSSTAAIGEALRRYFHAELYRRRRDEDHADEDA